MQLSVLCAQDRRKLYGVSACCCQGDLLPRLPLCKEHVCKLAEEARAGAALFAISTSVQAAMRTLQAQRGYSFRFWRPSMLALVQHAAAGMARTCTMRTFLRL